MARSSSAKKATDLVSGLSKALAQQGPLSQQEATSLPSAPLSEQKPSGREIGKAITIYLHPVDQKLIREISLYLAAHDVERVSNSLVIKTALRAAPRDQELLSSYREALKADKRYKKHKE